MTELKGIVPPSGAWIDGEFRFPIRVYYEDTDLGGMVYHGRYISFFERVRYESVKDTAASVEALLDRRADEGGPLVYVVRQIHVTYHRQAKAGDMLVGYTRVGRLRAAALEVEQRIERDGHLVAEARVVVAVVDERGRPQRWPKATRAAWQSWFDDFEKQVSEAEPQATT